MSEPSAFAPLGVRYFDLRPIATHAAEEADATDELSRGPKRLQLMRPDEWIAIAAVVQGAAALAIVGLTFFLARYARGATDAARRQADVANRALEAANTQAVVAAESVAVAARQADISQQALLQSDLQARLQSVGLLQLANPRPEDTPRGLLTLVEVWNKTDEPALDLELRIYALERDGSTFGPVGTSAQVPILASGDHELVSIYSHELRQTPSRGSAQPQLDPGGQPITPEGGYYSYDKLVIEAEWKSTRGSVASVSYVWYANAHNYEHGWRLRAMKIRPGGDESDEVAVNARRVT